MPTRSAADIRICRAKVSRAVAVSSSSDSMVDSWVVWAIICEVSIGLDGSWYFSWATNRLRNACRSSSLEAVF